MWNARTCKYPPCAKNSFVGVWHAIYEAAHISGFMQLPYFAKKSEFLFIEVCCHGAVRRHMSVTQIVALISESICKRSCSARTMVSQTGKTQTCRAAHMAQQPLTMGPSNSCYLSSARLPLIRTAAALHHMPQTKVAWVAEVPLFLTICSLDVLQVLKGSCTNFIGDSSTLLCQTQALLSCWYMPN